MVDASVAVQWFARETDSESSAAVLEGVRSLIAPDIMPLEVANALWRKARRGDLPEADLSPAVARLLDAHIVYVSTLALLPRAARLALQAGHPVYDCVYLALAAERGAPLATVDQRLRQAALRQGLSLWRR